MQAGVLDKIQQHCLLITLNVRCWHGRPQIDEANVSIDTETLTVEDATQPRWKLMPVSWQRQFQKLESKARNLIKVYSVPFKLRGVYVVPIGEADELFGRLRDVRDRYNELVDEFVDDYDEWTTALRSKLGEARYEKASNHIPDKKRMRKKFGLEWAIVPMGKTASTVATSDYMTEAEKTMDKLIDESFNNIVKQPKLELIAAISKMMNSLLNNRTTIRRPTIERLRRAIAKCRGFQQLTDDSIGSVGAAIDTINNTLDDLSPQRLNRDVELRQELVHELNDIRHILTEEK